MGRRGRLLAGGAVAAVGGLAAVLLLSGAIGGGGRGAHERLSLARLAAAVAPGGSVVLARAEQAAAGAESLHVALPDSLIRPAPGSRPPQVDSTAAAVYAGAGWRGALIAAVAAVQIPRLTQFVMTDKAGAQAPGASFFLNGSVRTTPGETLAGPMPMLGRVPRAATRKQLDDNLATLRRGLRPGSILGATVTEIPVDPAGHTIAYAVDLRVTDLRRLRSHLGDLLVGLATGLAPGPDSTVEGLAIHAEDRAGRSAGSWMATRARQGTTVVDPRIPPRRCSPRASTSSTRRAGRAPSRRRRPARSDGRRAPSASRG